MSLPKIEESKAISPEVKGLFELVKNQAKEYTYAFEDLQKKRDELDRNKLEFIKSARELREEVRNAIKELQASAEDSLKIVEQKTEKTIKIYNEFDKIEKLRESLSHTFDSMKEKTIEFEKRINEIKELSDSELENSLISLRKNIESEIETAISKLEFRLSLNVKRFDGKLLNLDQKLWAMAESHLNSNNKINDELDDLNKKINKIKSLKDDIFSEVNFRFNEANDEILSHITPLQNMVNDLNKIKATIEGKKYATENQIDDIDYILQGSIKKIGNRIDKINTRINITLFVSILAILASIGVYLIK